jgi:purine-nucleoside phosphorylase
MMNMDTRLERINTAAAYLKEQLGEFRPFAGIVLGSGLGKLADKIEDKMVIPYKEIPGFPVSTAVGHKGNFIAGYLGGKPVIAMQGRFHYYEGYSMDLVTLPIRVMKVLGISYLFVSNAAGGVNFDFKVGDLMVIKDHINHLPNPLVGPNLEEFGPRFPDMTRPYEPKLISLAEQKAGELGIALKKGVYFAGTGPSYETPSEYKYFRLIGADAVGMSTVPEAIVAARCGMEVLGISCITNMAAGMIDGALISDEEVTEVAQTASDRFSALVCAVLERMGDGDAV